MNTIEELIHSLHQQGFETDADLVIHGNNEFGIAYMPIPWMNIEIGETSLVLNLMGQKMNFSVPADFIKRIEESKNVNPSQSVCTLVKKRDSILNNGSLFEILLFTSDKGSVGDPVFDRNYNDFIFRDLFNSLGITDDTKMKNLFKTAYKMYKKDMGITDDFDYIRDAYAQNN